MRSINEVATKSFAVFSLIFLISLTFSFNAEAATIEVYAGQSIQAAVDSASVGDTISIAAGTYNESINITKSNLTLKALDPNSRPVIDSTGTGTSGISSSGYNGLTLDGLIIRNSSIYGINAIGGSQTITNCVVENNGNSGIYSESSSSTISNCEVKNNSFSGIFLARGNSRGIYNCIIENNSGSNGGGIRLYNAPTTISSCTIKNNTVSGFGGGVYSTGDEGRNYVTNIANCIISNNSASNGGGVFYTKFGYTPAYISNTLISSNTATYGGGGGIHLDTAPNTKITNCTITGNNSSYTGGGIYLNIPDYYGTGTTIDIINCIVYYNTASQGAAVTLLGTPVTNIIHSDINASNIYNGVLPWFNYLNTANNINADPGFVDAANGNYHITWNSPCIDKGTPYGAPSTDFDGDTRPSGAGVDIGFDEVAIINVPADFATIQGAIDSANDYSSILVAPGTYNENIDFKGKSLILKSISGPLSTTISSISVGDSVVKFVNGEDAYTVLDGFTITNGHGWYEGGGGIRGESASPTVRNCIISGNITEGYGGGGGIYFTGKSAPKIEKCIIQNNTAGFGGGIALENECNATISNCYIDNNKSDKLYYSYGHPDGFGGGIALTTKSNANIENCTAKNNKAVYGGGIYLWNSDAKVLKSSISDNTANYSGGGIYFLSSQNSELVNCEIVDNTGNAGGYAIYCSDSSPLITNSTISNNKALISTYEGAMHLEYNSIPTILNSIFWANTNPNNFENEICLGNSNTGIYPIINNTDIDPNKIVDSRGRPIGLTNPTNINMDPKFVDPTAGDYHLKADSPCIDKGASLGAPSDDIDGEARPSGSGVDLGSDEAQINTPTGNGVVVITEDIDITFSNVDTEGITTVTKSAQGPVAPVNFNILGQYYDVTTTAVFSGTVDLCFTYDDNSLPAGYDESLLKLLHNENGQWVNVTASLDTVNNIICGQVSGFSEFIIGYQTFIDSDYDGIADDVDNCIDTPNADQVDFDSDGYGDACDNCPNDPDNDIDGDGVCGDVDNCVDTPNPAQTDVDGDGIGDACDDCFNAPITGSISASDETLWPPNHKMVEVIIDASGLVFSNEEASVTISSIEVIEYGKPGDDNIYEANPHEPDFEISGDLTVNLRSERSGQSTGRIYRITVTATDCHSSETFTVDVTVPHDKGN